MMLDADSRGDFMNLPEPEWRRYVVNNFEKYDDKFDSVMSAVQEQASTLQAHAHASEKRHRELLETLAPVISLQENSRRGFDFIRWIGERLNDLGLFARKVVNGIAVFVIVWSLMTGKFTVSDVGKFFIKLFGG